MISKHKRCVNYNFGASESGVQLQYAFEKNGVHSAMLPSMVWLDKKPESDVVYLHHLQ